MKIVRRTSKASKKKQYYKHDVTIPSEAIKNLGWEKGTELDYEIQKGKLILKKRYEKNEQR